MLGSNIIIDVNEQHFFVQRGGGIEYGLRAAVEFHFNKFVPFAHWGYTFKT